MGDANKLCYKANDGRLAYKASGDDAGKLVYKVAVGDWTTITFAWSTKGRDLDICAFWVGAPDMKMGYSYNTNKTEQISGAYHIFYSGDETGTNTAEWVRIKMIPWSTGSRTFKVYFNFYEYSSSYPESECTVIASQINGPTIIKRNQPCGTSYHNPATTSSPVSPSCTIEFDGAGRLVSVT